MSWQSLLNSVRATVARMDDGCFLLRFSSYDELAFEEAVRLVKHLPTRDRRYDPEWRAWQISSLGMRGLCSIWPQLRAAWEAAQVDGPTCDRLSGDIPLDVEKAFTTLHLLPNAPTEVVQAAYRALARIAHPDAGGDTEAMKRLNLAHERVRAWMSVAESAPAPKSKRGA